MNNEKIVFLEPDKIDSVPFTTSEVIAECAEVRHHAIQQMIQKHEMDFKEFGVIAFEMRKPPIGSKGGRPEIIYHLNEQQATLLMTYLKNTDVVRKFKIELVRQFYAMWEELRSRREYRTALKPIRRELTDVIREVDTSKWAYKKYTDLAYKTSIGKNASQLRKERNAPPGASAADYMTSREIAAVAKRQGQIAVLLEMGFDYIQVKDCLYCGANQKSEKRKALKRTNGLGTVYKLQGRRSRPWVAAKNKTILGYYGTKIAAIEALNRLTGRSLDERYNMTFSDVFEAWKLEHYKDLTKSAKTQYDIAFQVFATLHNKKFRELRTADFQAMIDPHMGKSYSNVSKYK